jgi:hypothetical protein
MRNWRLLNKPLVVLRHLAKIKIHALLVYASVFGVAYMDVGQGREQGAEALRQELHQTS